MDRLTYTSPLGNRVSKGACAGVQCMAGCDACGIYRIISKLWEYEETGLTPQEVEVLKAENREMRGRLDRVRVAAMP